MDMELSQLDKIYLSNLINYNKVVNQRNKLLKELSFKSSEEKLETLDIWGFAACEVRNGSHEKAVSVSYRS